MSNAQYSKIENTDLDAGHIMSQLGDAQQATNQLKWIHGAFTPRAAGNYAVVDDRGDQIELSTRAFVLRSFVIGSTDLAGGTNVNVGGGATAGGAVVTTLTGGVQTTANLVAGWRSTAPATALGATNYFVNATTTGTYTAGSVDVVLEVLEM